MAGHILSGNCLGPDCTLDYVVVELDATVGKRCLPGTLTTTCFAISNDFRCQADGNNASIAAISKLIRRSEKFAQF
ncbi:hypothetical protein J2861_005491 [Agrobacterium tumefaciens]|nr:hypothetical protein [Agrobacterium tumefaciens]